MKIYIKTFCFSYIRMSGFLKDTDHDLLFNGNKRQSCSFTEFKKGEFNNIRITVV